MSRLTEKMADHIESKFQSVEIVKAIDNIVVMLEDLEDQGIDVEGNILTFINNLYFGNDEIQGTFQPGEWSSR